VQGKVTDIIRTTGSNKANLHFQYDALGNRVSKTVIYPTSIDGVKELTTYYVKDASGNTMAVYEKQTKDNDTEQLFLQEQHLYGSSRLGMFQSNILLATRNGNTTTPNPDIDLAFSSREIGSKYYELTGHTGNVLAVVSDKKLANNEPDIVSASDFYPFGMQMSGRNYKSDVYRYGFGGHEKDDEVKGNGNHLSFGDFGYDPRLGRRWRPDPVDQISISNYAAFRNNSIFFIDPDGRFNLPNYTEEQLSDRGLTTDDMNRFTTLVSNIGNLVNNNPKALDVISKSTGLSQEQILNDFKFGEGTPMINIVDDNAGSYARDGQITIQAQIVRDLANVDFNAVNRSSGHKELARQAFATSMLVIHEYGHYGDQQTNDGYNTGQYHPTTGVSDVDFDFGASSQAKSKREGQQEWSLTKTGHRGTDVTKYGFGADITGINSIRLQNTSNNSEYLRGNMILNLLEIKE
jgi:RHS repeat-associated protein